MKKNKNCSLCGELITSFVITRECADCHEIGCSSCVKEFNQGDMVCKICKIVRSEELIIYDF